MFLTVHFIWNVLLVFPAAPNKLSTVDLRVGCSLLLFLSTSVPLARAQKKEASSLLLVDHTKATAFIHDLTSDTTAP
jgi:hypothetical protein